MSTMTSQISDTSIVCSTVCSGADQRKHQSSPSLAFVRGIHLSLVDSPHKGPVTWKVFPFGDVIMQISIHQLRLNISPNPSMHQHFISMCLDASLGGNVPDTLSGTFSPNEASGHIDDKDHCYYRLSLASIIISLGSSHTIWHEIYQSVLI